MESSSKKTIKKLLIANRGEIAVRVIRACQELGIKTVAVFSSADKDALHTRIADESVCIGAAPSSQSYLGMTQILSAVEITGADAIHPGYGFLSENFEFAQLCERFGITFVGPTSEQIRTLGNKVLAKDVARKHEVPLMPGSDGVVKSVDEAKKIADKIGFPLIIKAAGGGGGRGMKIIRQEADLMKVFDVARSEAERAFGNPDVFIERYAENPRHIEIQILGDKYGNVIHLGERDCSTQRRHQKIIEESPSPIVNAELREKIANSALRLVKAVGYQNAGTVEFLLEDTGNFYFMEMNTRLQVEHPVTEQVTGFDLVKEQIRVAEGYELKYSQKDVQIKGHSIECRINAEDPSTFAPWPGKIQGYHEPGGPGIRIDSMLYAGYTVASQYDSMIGKLIATGKDRAEAIARMLRALQEMKVDGIRTNIPLHIRILQTPEFQAGKISTRFLENFLKTQSFI